MGQRQVGCPRPSQSIPRQQPASKKQAAASAGIVLRTDDSWASPYFDPNDLRFLDRQLFG